MGLLKARYLFVLLLTAFCLACGGGGDGGEESQPPAAGDAGTGGGVDLGPGGTGDAGKTDTGEQPPLNPPDTGTQAGALSFDEGEMSATIQGGRIFVGLVVHKTGDGKVDGRLDVSLESLDGVFKQSSSKAFQVKDPVDTLTADLPAFNKAEDPEVQAVHVIRYTISAGELSVSGTRSVFVTLPKSQVVVLGPKRFHAGVPTNIKLFARNAVTGEPFAKQRLLVKIHEGDESREEEAETDSEGAASMQVTFQNAGGGAIIVSKPDEIEEAAEHPVDIVRTSRVLVTTDKPLYQPGQTMHLRVLALRQPDLDPEADTSCLVEVFDGRGNKVSKLRLRTSDFGIAAGTFKLANEVNVGTYRVRATVGDTVTEKAVTVERYSLPKFGVEVELDKPFYLVGDTLRGTVLARYFFGKPVAGGDVRIRLQTFDVEFSDFATVNGATDDEGIFAFETTLPGHLVGQDLEQGKAIVRLVAEVTDAAGQSVAKDRGVHVAGDRFRVVVVPESGVLAPGMENVFYVFAEDPAGAPVVATVDLSADGDVYSLQTDENGFAKASHVPAGRRVEVTWSADDGTGEPVEGAAVFEAGRSNEAVLVRTDKAIYQVGDTMEVTIFAPDARDRVYLDVVRHGQLAREEGLDLEGGMAQAQVDLDSEMTGDLAVVAYYLGGMGTIVRDEKLVWVDSAAALTVLVTPDKEVYEPGETATLSFDVSDTTGAPAVAAIGVQVVDEAVFALSDSRPGLLRTYFELDESIREPKFQIRGTGFDLPGICTNVPTDEAGGTVREQQAEAAFAAVDDPSGRRFTSSWEGMLVRTIEPLKPFYEADKEAVFERIRDKAGTGEVNESNLLEWLEGERGLIDPFGDPYRFSSAGSNKIEMRSDGPDEIAETADDWSTSFNTWVVYGDDMPVWDADGEFPGPPMAGGGGGDTNEGTSGAGGDDGPRVRQDFPETLYFNPEIITGPDGRASVEIGLADSITEWRISSLANSAGGLLGSNATGMTVFMDFFADIDLPRTMTRGDEVHFPVAVYNYLDEQQTVSLEVEVGEWAELLSSASTSITLDPGQVGGVKVGLRASRVGWHGVKVTARGSKGAADALIRTVEVMPDGVEDRGSVSGKLSDTVSQTVDFPETAIEGTEKIIVKIHPGVVAQAVEGLDSLLRMPSGCFEQTTSTLWPNALVLDYLTVSGRSSPEIELKAREFISLGYQRLLTFECTGGGFTWFGDPAPANIILSAMGVMEFSDIAKVQEIDETLIPRTMDFLATKQAADGSWHEDQGSEFATIRYTDLMTTCFVTWALAQAGGGEAAEAGFNYAQAQLDESTPTYALALCANAFATLKPTSSKTSQAIADLISRAQNEGEDKVFWEPGAGGESNYPGSGGGGSAIETTALAVLALLEASSAPDLAAGGLAYLTGNKDSFGNWGTTHATILSLKAFVSSLTAVPDKAEGNCTIAINGQVVEELPVSDENSDVFHQFELAPWLDTEGSNEVELFFVGEGSLMYQIVWSHYVPGAGPENPGGPIGIELSYDKTTLSTDDTVRATATITNRSGRALPMVLVDLGIPPGFTVLTDDLEAAAEEQRIQKYEMTARQILVYLEAMMGEQVVELSYGLKAKYPLKVKAPDSSAALYYDDSSEASSPGAEFEVEEAQ